MWRPGDGGGVVARVAAVIMVEVEGEARVEAVMVVAVMVVEVMAAVMGWR